MQKRPSLNPEKAARDLFEVPPRLACLLEHGKKGRDELLRRFDQEGHGHLSRVGRSPVMESP